MRRIITVVAAAIAAVIMAPVAALAQTYPPTPTPTTTVTPTALTGADTAFPILMVFALVVIGLAVLLFVRMRRTP